MAFEWLSDLGKATGITGGDVLKAGAGIASGIINQSAADKASSAQSAAGDRALALQEKAYADSQKLLAPYQATGNAANKKLSQLMGLQGFDSNSYAANLRQQYPALFGGIGAAANPSNIYEASGDVLSAVQGINSGGYKYNQADFQRLIDAAGQVGYDDYTREDVISAAQRLADPNSQTKTQDSQFLVDKFNRLHNQFDPKPKKKKGWFSKLLPAAVGLAAGAALGPAGFGLVGSGIGGTAAKAAASQLASGATEKALA